MSSPEFTLVDYPTMDDRLGNRGLKSSDRLKQEKNVFHWFSMRYGTITKVGKEIGLRKSFSTFLNKSSGQIICPEDSFLGNQSDFRMEVSLKWRVILITGSFLGEFIFWMMLLDGVCCQVHCWSLHLMLESSPDGSALLEVSFTYISTSFFIKKHPAKSSGRMFFFSTNQE